jgi:ribulose-5-phosphate 4-epimerase/fuculose-1-phosphate aldolase
MSSEGYIKYQCIWTDSAIQIPELVKDSINSWRKKLYDLSLIGANESGIGYGNISIRNKNNTFFITGSATGEKPILAVNDLALVQEWDFDNNQLKCTGKTKASSESLTHAAIYESDAAIGSVIHVHSGTIWDQLMHKVPTSSAVVEYGTPAMAREIEQLLKDKKNRNTGIVAMGGHEEGILVYGKNIHEAGKIILSYYHQCLNNSTMSDPG